METSICIVKLIVLHTSDYEFIMSSVSTQCNSTFDSRSARVSFYIHVSKVEVGTCAYSMTWSLFILQWN